jgi:hypothetical protein
MSMSEEDKMVLYAVLQDIADELRKIPKAEREKRRKIYTASRKFDERGRIVLELKENMVTEHIYYDDPTTPRVAFPSYAKWQVYWRKGDEKTIAEGVATYDLSKKGTQQMRPDLLVWANEVREKIAGIENDTAE